MVINSQVPPKFIKREERKAVQQASVKVRCRLQDLLDAESMTRSALAGATGLNASAIRGLCDNTSKRYDMDTIAALCEFFNCQVGDLFELIPKQQ